MTYEKIIVDGMYATLKAKEMAEKEYCKMQIRVALLAGAKFDVRGKIIGVGKIEHTGEIITSHRVALKNGDGETVYVQARFGDLDYGADFIYDAIHDNPCIMGNLDILYAQLSNGKSLTQLKLDGGRK